MIPRVVPKAQLETAMSVFNLTLQGSFAVGFAFLGPLLVSIAGPSFVLGVVTAFYVAASIACFGLPSAPPIAPKPGEHRRTFGEPIQELRAGLAVVRHEPTISRPIVLLATATSVASVLGVLGPSLAVTVGLEPEHLAVVVVPLGIGVVWGCSACGGSAGRGRGAAWPRAACSSSASSPRPSRGGLARRLAAERRHPGRGAPGGDRHGDRRRRGLRGDLGDGPDEPDRVDPARCPRPRVRRARVHRVRGLAHPVAHGGAAADRLSTGVAIATAGLILIVVAFWSIRRRA